MIRTLRVAAAASFIILIQAVVPAYAQSSKPDPVIAGNQTYMILQASMGITPAQVARFNVSILSSKPRAADFQGGCQWAGFIWFEDQNGKQVGSRTKFTLESGQTAHGDLDGVIGPPDDQYGRKQVRPVGIIGPPDSQPGAQNSSGHCAALVGASFEVFDKQTGGTVSAVDSFFIAPVDRAEPPPSPIEQKK